VRRDQRRIAVYDARAATVATAMARRDVPDARSPDGQEFAMRSPRSVHKRFADGIAIVILVTSMTVAPAHGAACSAKSGPQSVPLAELYTSEGCSSCPPADRWLSTTFSKTSPRSSGIALAFHVDYWDRLGWKDRFATPAFTQRQYDGMRASGTRFVYTPQVMIQGRDFPQWHGRDAIAALTAAAAKPARAEIALTAEREPGSILVKATARVPSAADRKGAALYVALADDGLSSEVKAGENAGTRLVHDNVVRVFRAGPLPDATGEMRWDVKLPIPAEAGSASTVVAFVQNAAAGDVLQALALPLTRECAAGKP
jgi:hypothetical protein